MQRAAVPTVKGRRCRCLLRHAYCEFFPWSVKAIFACSGDGARSWPSFRCHTRGGLWPWNNLYAYIDRRLTSTLTLMLSITGW